MHVCTAWLNADDLHIRLHHPARGIVRGQAAVLYAGNTVLGSATIASTSVVASPAPRHATTTSS